MNKFIDLTNQKFGKLTVLSRTENIKGRKNWNCKCECGKEVIVRQDHLRSEKIRSCGCLAKRNHVIHGKYKTRLYRIWECMKTRCYTNRPIYNSWNGRGIIVCKEWLQDFMNFYNWAVNNGYTDNLSIDRINNNGNYEPNNCRWATPKEQANNKGLYKKKGAKTNEV